MTSLKDLNDDHGRGTGWTNPGACGWRDGPEYAGASFSLGEKGGGGNLVSPSAPFHDMIFCTTGGKPNFYYREAA